MSFVLCKTRPSTTTPADPARAARAGPGRRKRKAGKKRAGARRCLGAASEEAAVAERLEVLKGLVPSSCRYWRTGCVKVQEATGPAGADRLFEETAVYIILLRERVGVLQRLLEVYGPGEEKSHAEVAEHSSG